MHPRTGVFVYTLCVRPSPPRFRLDCILLGAAANRCWKQRLHISYVRRPETLCGRHLSFSRRASLLVPRAFLKKTFRPGVHPILRGCGSSPDLITCGAKRGASCLKIFVEKIRGKLNCGRTVTIPRLGTEMVSPRGTSTVQPRATVTVQRRGSAKRPCRGVVGAGGSHGDGRWAHAEAAA